MYAMCDIFSRSDIYEAMLCSELKKNGMTPEEIASRVTLKLVMAACHNRRKPEDIAWAMMQ